MKDKRFHVNNFRLKHVMFWTMEEVRPTQWRMNNLYNCVAHVLRKFEEFLEDSCIPHYFFGYKVNLMNGSDIEMDPKHFPRLREKCRVMKREIKLLRTNLVKALAGLVMADAQSRPDEVHVRHVSDPLIGRRRVITHGNSKKGFLDYQWDFNEPYLVDSYLDMTVALSSLWHVPDKEKLKEAVIKHHWRMIYQIENAPRKYGRGENTELLKHLVGEVLFLEKRGRKLEDLWEFDYHLNLHILNKMQRLFLEKDKESKDIYKLVDQFEGLKRSQRDSEDREEKRLKHFADYLHSREKHTMLKHIA